MSLVDAAPGRSEGTSALLPSGNSTLIDLSAAETASPSSAAGDAMESRVPSPTPTRPSRTVGRIFAAYAALAKPRVIELLLVTTIPAMFLAGRQVPSPLLVLVTLLGGTMAAASANAINCVIDADIDKVMNRTKRRPLVRDSVPRRNALIFGVVLGVGAFAILYFTVNLLAAAMAIATIAFYIFIYTLLLKRRTSQNVVWGGAAGCMPVVIGWAAVSGTVQWPALVMFGVIFFWTPPHTWALAMKYREDYARAGVPMLPVVAAPDRVTRQIVIYSWVMVACTLALAPVTSAFYLAVAVAAGAWFLFYAHSLHAAVSRGEETKPMALFHRSNTYLMVVFCALAVDSALSLPTLF